MTPMIWGPMFEVGVQGIDTEHVRLFNLANELADAIMQHREQTVINHTLQELLRYTQTHFAAEEQLMVQHRYPGAEEHRRRHQLLTQQVNEYRQAQQAGDPEAADKVLRLFTGWLAEHIMQIDKAFARYLKLQEQP
ncbi:MAG: bacteriohemerythrin [Geobacter sp.]|jgi:hemerythrin|nr:bacteriohemerythrin [Geobacter sp.]